MKEATSSGTIGSVEAGTAQHFRDFSIAPDVLAALAQMGIEVPTPIQQACIPSILDGKDVVGKAETGTGKTIGFGAPLVGRIDTNRVAVQALVLTPTRELAQQVAGVLELLGAGRGLGVALVVGGVHASEQILKLRSGSQVVVGTPGRVLDFLRERTLSLVWCETVVLDEADRMLDMGFIDDVTAILDKTPKERQTLLFSATIPPEIGRLLKRYMRTPEQFSTSKGLSTVSEIRQFGIECDFRHKFRTLQQVLESHQGSTVLIFCNTRRQAIDLDRMLWGHGYSAGALHGDQEQDVRFKILEAFRGGDIRILVATDVASRGLDIEDIACVVNYEIPSEPESYVHRIGRTGRAQRTGEAISIVAGKELGAWRRILKQTGFKIQRLTSGHTSPRGTQALPTSRNGGAQEATDEARRGEISKGTPRRGVPTVAPENEPPNPLAPIPNGQAPVVRAVEARAEAGGPSRAGGGPAGESEERRGSRRRRRRGGGGGGGGGGGEAGGGRDGGGHRDGRGGPERAQRPTQGGDRPSRPQPPQLRTDDGYVEDVPTPEETQAWLQSRAKSETPKPERIRLEDVDDDYLKTDYFEIDHALVERAGPSPLPRPARERSERSESQAKDAPAAPSGRRPDRSGRAPRPEGRERPRGPDGRGGPPAQGSSPPAQGSGAPRGEPQADAGDGRRRRRRRRGRGGRGGGGGGGGGGERGHSGGAPGGGSPG